MVRLLTPRPTPLPALLLPGGDRSIVALALQHPPRLLEHALEKQWKFPLARSRQQASRVWERAFKGCTAGW